MDLRCFKAYDIRGCVPDELDETLAQRIGVTLAQQLDAGRVATPHSCRNALKKSARLSAIEQGQGARRERRPSSFQHPR